MGFPQEEPLLLLWPALAFNPWAYLPLVYFFTASSSTNGRSSSVSTSEASMNCPSGAALPLPVPVNVAVVMPPGQWDAPPRGVCFVLTIY